MPELKTQLIQRFGKNIMIIEEGFDTNLLVKTIETLSEKPDVIIVCGDDGLMGVKSLLKEDVDVINERDISPANLPLSEVLKDFRSQPIIIKPYVLPMVEPYYLDEIRTKSNPHRNPKSGNCKIVRK